MTMRHMALKGCVSLGEAKKLLILWILWSSVCQIHESSWISRQEIHTNLNGSFVERGGGKEHDPRRI